MRSLEMRIATMPDSDRSDDMTISRVENQFATFTAVDDVMVSVPLDASEEEVISASPYRQSAAAPALPLGDYTTIKLSPAQQRKAYGNTSLAKNEPTLSYGNVL